VKTSPDPSGVDLRQRCEASVCLARLNRLITGRVAYFRLAQRVSVLGKLDGWLRRCLRQIC